MKVLNIYCKKDLDVLTCNGVIVSKIMNGFFKKYPSIYRRNYDNNLRNIEIWKVDEHYDGTVAGEYFRSQNILLLRNFNSFIHELMHVSSFDSETEMSAFCRNANCLFFEEALLEGMTEYLAAVALEGAINDYFFECFTVSMLSNIEGIFGPYFIPSHKNFMNLFPNKKNIISLMYALSFYYEKNVSSINLSDMDRTRMEHSVCDVLDSLIDIQVSMKMKREENIIYAEKFMDLLSTDIIQDSVIEYSDDCLDYANEQINKKLLRRI